jgi:hypothetical protein
VRFLKNRRKYNHIFPFANPVAAALLTVKHS